MKPEKSLLANFGLQAHQSFMLSNRLTSRKKPAIFIFASPLNGVSSKKTGMIIPPAYKVCYGGIMFSSFLSVCVSVCVCACVCVSVNNFHVRSITLKTA